MYLIYIHTILREREIREKNRNTKTMSCASIPRKRQYVIDIENGKPPLVHQSGRKETRRRETKIPKLTSKVNQNTSKRERERERRHTPTVNKKKLFKRKHIENLEVIDRLYT